MKATAKTVPVKKEKVAPLARREPEGMLYSLRDEVEDVFDRFFGEWGRWPMLGRMPGKDLFADWPAALRFEGGGPKVDVTESDKAFEINAELPGMDEKDIEVLLNEGMLTLKGEKRAEHEDEGKDYHIAERRYGEFRRSFMVPETVDAGKVTAKFAKGVLHVTMPKSKEAVLKQRKVPIQG